MALTMTSTAKTDWNIQEGSEDAEFQWKDDGATRETRMVLRIVLTREHHQVSGIDFAGDTSLPSDVSVSSIQANGPTTAAFTQWQQYYEQLDVISSRLVPHEAKGGDFMQEIVVIEGFSKWSAFEGDQA